MTINTASPTALVWCDPVERGDLKLAPGDITDAIKWFTEKTGQPPRQIFLCPKNERFASEIPEEITVVYINGVLLWEIQLTGAERWEPVPAPSCPDTLKDVNQYLGLQNDKKVSQHTPTILATPKPKKIRVAKIKSPTPKVTRKKKKETRGRKKLKLPGRKIMAMNSAGMGAKSISNKLRDKYNVIVSFRSVARFINENQQRLL